jgi:putative nucleotidyltransferase with HDIG domain
MNELMVPALQEAEDVLLWAHEQNPGHWVDHSRTVARAAQTIALQCGMDGDTAYILGLLHDIGRYEGATGLRHVYAGYNLMNERGYSHNARICLTHSFPDKDIKSFYGNNDCTKDETKEIKLQLKRCEYDDYDRLIQLCDTISFPQGIGVMEIRFVNAARRYNILNKRILKKWNAFYKIKTCFDDICGMNIYHLFYEEIAKNCVTCVR